MTHKQQNILLIMAQMTPFMREACGGVGAKTENMKKLAARAASFTNSFPQPDLRSCSFLSYVGA